MALDKEEEQQAIAALAEEKERKRVQEISAGIEQQQRDNDELLRNQNKRVDRFTQPSKEQESTERDLPILLADLKGANANLRQVESFTLDDKTRDEYLKLYDEALNTRDELNATTKTIKDKEELDKHNAKLDELQKQIQDMHKLFNTRSIEVKDPAMAATNDKSSGSGIEVEHDTNAAKAFEYKNQLFDTNDEKTIIGKMVRAAINLYSLLDQVGLIDSVIRIPASAVTTTAVGLSKRGWSNAV